MYNDLAIDNIIFRSYGDRTTITSDDQLNNELLVFKTDKPFDLNFYATPNYSVYESYVFQWQESFDNETWQDIPKETSEDFSTSISSGLRYYRVKVAESEVNNC